MLSQKNRFHGHGSLRYMFKNGNTARSRYLVLRYIANPRRRNSRVAIVVSKKIHKQAVRRNRIRRRLYHIVRRKLSDIDSSYDIAIIVTSPETISLSPDDLQQQVSRLLATAGLCKSSR